MSKSVARVRTNQTLAVGSGSDLEHVRLSAELNYSRLLERNELQYQ